MSALRGAIGFLTVLPVGMDERAWNAFRRRPATIPIVGYLLGLPLAALVTALPANAVGGFALVLGVYLLTGINHVDGLTDLADAIAVHGPREARIAALRDERVGVGGGLALGLVLLGLFAAGTALGRGGLEVAGIVVAAEVAAKLSMTIGLAAGSPRHEGLGATVGEHATVASVGVGTIAALPAAALAWPSPAAAVGLVAGTVAGLGPLWLATERLGGTSGDALGAANEVARLAGLLAGVIAWTQL